jgi:hypothetical protein
MARPQEYSSADCIAALRRAADVFGPEVSRSQYKSLDYTPSVTTVQRKLGGWNTGKKVAGLTPTPKTNMWELAAITTALEDAKAELGPSFSRTEYDEGTFGPSSRTISRRYPGGWLSALADHGVKGHTASTQSYSDANAVVSLVELTIENDGTAPGVVQYRESGCTPSYKTLTKKFGVGWSELKTVAEIAAQLYSERNEDLSVRAFCEEFIDGVAEEAEIDAVSSQLSVQQ